MSIHFRDVPASQLTINQKHNPGMNEILDQLYALHRNGIKPGLERTSQLLAEMGNPHLKLKAVHVAGTNGKGSVCAVVASVLKEAGYKVGLYTSPHIVDFNERIRINGEMISDEDLSTIAKKTLELGKNIDATFFEITTAIAFEYFVSQNVDIAVIETGLGGKFDSTNILSPVVSIITDIDMDHKEFLGENLEEIAKQKAGIIKEKIPVVIQESRSGLKEIFQKEAVSKSAPLYLTDDIVTGEIVSFETDLSINFNVITPYDNYSDLTCKLSGDHQLRNIKTAILALEELKHKFFWSTPHLSEGLKNITQNTGHYARIEIISLAPLIIMDVSHNTASLQALIDVLEKSGYNDYKFDIVFAAMEDKNYLEMLKLLQPYCSNLYLTKPKIQRAVSTDKLSEAAKSVGITSVIEISKTSLAVKQALEKDNNLIIAGSFYLIGEAMEVLENFFLTNKLNFQF